MIGRGCSRLTITLSSSFVGRGGQNWAAVVSYFKVTRKRLFIPGAKKAGRFRET